jgi:PPOX class probable F420-dependent enzyme
MSQLKPFKNQKYLNLETYRKNEEGVQTPVWFVEVDGELIISTDGNSGKVKRIRRNPKVRIAPCDMRGTVKGDFIPATARFLTAEETEKISEPYVRKYGIAGRMFTLTRFARNSSRIFLAIKPEKDVP